MRRIWNGRGVLRNYSMNKQPSASASKYASLPKVELHVHADGACRVSTLRELSRQHGCPYPHDNEEQFRKLVTLPSVMQSLTEFLKVFDVVTDILRTKDSLERIAYEFCEDCAQQNVLYAEYRFSPYLDAASSCSGEEYCDGIFAGLERGERDFGIKVRSILVFMRNLPERVEDVVKLCERYKNSWVVGVDMAGDESLPLDARHVAGFRKAKEMGLHVTVHAAESGPAANVEQAVREMGAERIGHGYHVLDDPRIYKLAKDKGLHFETCPSSSVFTNSSQFEDHAMQRFAQDGVSFSVNTDDPGIMDCTLTGEYNVTETRIGLTQHQIMRSVVCGAESAFLPPKERKELVETVKEKLTQFDPTFKSQSQS